MYDLRFRNGLQVILCLIHILVLSDAMAGGSGLNTVVVVNQNSPNSLAAGNYFCERREVPPENVLRISWSGGNISWSSNEFQSVLLDPLLTMLATRQLNSQIDYVVLSMDIPFQTVNDTAVNSTTSALYYGVKTDSGTDSKETTNSYAASEGVFQKDRPASAHGSAFLATMITANSLAEARFLVDQGVNSDGTFPSAPVVLAKSSDSLRNVRYHAFDNAIFNIRVRGNYSILRTNSDSPGAQSNLLGYQTGLANFSISPGAFVPGAMADSLTSFGGIIFGPNGQTTLLAFIHAGAAGSYGTVTEPSPDPQKFPDPQLYFYQSRGFSLAECYYQSLLIPFEGLIVGEPLAAPFSRTGSGQWSGITSNAILTGVTPISVQFSAADRDRPLNQVDLFVDGKFFKTLTNLPPPAGNLLKLTVQGFPVNYTVPANATLASIASALAALINGSASLNSNVTAFACGDRIELHSVSKSSTNRPAAPTNLGVQSGAAAGSSPRQAPFFATSTAGTAGSIGTYLGTGLSVALESPAQGTRGCTVKGAVQAGSWLRLTVTKTNGSIFTVSATNQSAGATTLALANLLVTRINSVPAPGMPDGLMAEDVLSDWFVNALFNLRARSPGLEAASIKIILTGSTNLTLSPPGTALLNENLSDLQPRSHIYVTAGTAALASNFTLDTTLLPDGYHQLTAVAYEGSHVRTQTRTSLPVRIQNSPLTGTITLPDLPVPASAQSSWHVEIVASTNNISAITLFSTGGALDTISNQASATFTLNGSSFGPGLHPFYAVIETANGGKYRTETRWVRLTD